MARGVGAPFRLLASLPLPVLQLQLVSSSCALLCSACGGDLLTKGFTALELAEAQFVVQKPYDVPLPERYEFVDGMRRMWVYATDKPISTEIKVDVRTSLYALSPSASFQIFLYVVH
jgi:hypothetical protein